MVKTQFVEYFEEKKKNGQNYNSATADSFWWW